MQPKSSPINFQRLTLAVSCLSVTLALIAPYAKAGPLEELNQTLTQTVTNVTHQVLNPINQVQTTLTQTVDQVEDTVNQAIGNTVGGVLQPIQGAIGNLWGDANSGIASFLNPFQSLIQSFTTFIQNTLENLLGGVLGSESASEGHWNESLPHTQPGSQTPHQTADATTPHIGSLGLPDIRATHAAIDQMAQNLGNSSAQRSDRFNVNPLAFAYSIKAEADRKASRGVAETVMGTAGQKHMAEENKAASQALQFIQQTAAASQKKDVTQDVLKDLTTMTSAQSSLVAGSYAQLMGVRQQIAADSAVNSNISEGVDEANRMEHAERMNMAVSVLNAASNFYLPGQVK